VVPVTAIAGAGWLFLFVVLLIVPPSPGPRRGGALGNGTDRGPDGDEPPAMCVVPAETPGGALTPFERRVLAHVALRAGAAGQVPAPALSDGFEGGQAATVPAAVAAARQHYWLAWAAGLYVAGYAAAPGDGRLAGYAAALGGAPAALGVFAPGRKNTAWTSYRGGWVTLAAFGSIDFNQC
jgi:hypothetical protein